MELKIEYVDIDSIKPYENNPRHNEEAIPYVMNSIREFGFKNPIIIDKNNVIIAGHTRLESAKRLGMKEVPIIHADDLTEEQVKAFRLADNKVSEKAEWNFELLDEELAKNQEKEIRCGDNGIFKGVPLTDNEKEISWIANTIYNKYNCDGKYILTNEKLIICQSNADSNEIYEAFRTAYPELQVIVNPLGEWTGGTDVDTGATNRKLGSDMGHSVTGGGLHGKDLSKADVSVNIYAFLKAQKTGKIVELCCAIGDDTIDGKPYSEIVEIARKYIKDIGGFEKFAEWGLF